MTISCNMETSKFVAISLSIFVFSLSKIEAQFEFHQTNLVWSATTIKGKTNIFHVAGDPRTWVYNPQTNVTALAGHALYANVEVLAFAFAKQRLYYYDSISSAIYYIDHANDDSDDTRDPILHVYTSSAVQGLCVDWVNNNIYWSSSSQHRIYINSLKQDRRNGAVLIDGDVESPKNIVVDPLEHYIFWSETGAAKRIRRATLAGDEVTDIVTSSAFYPFALTLDYAERRLYWADYQKGSIECVDYHGDSINKIASFDSTSFVGITHYEAFIFALDQNYARIIVLNKTDTNVTDVTKTRSFHIGERSKVYDIIMYDATQQPSGVSACANTTCDLTCVTTSSGHSQCTVAADDHASDHGTPVAIPIVLGVVGGLICLSIILLVIFYVLYRHKSRVTARNRPRQDDTGIAFDNPVYPQNFGWPGGEVHLPPTYDAAMYSQHGASSTNGSILDEKTGLPPYAANQYGGQDTVSGARSVAGYTHANSVAPSEPGTVRSGSAPSTGGTVNSAYGSVMAANSPMAQLPEVRYADSNK